MISKNRGFEKLKGITVKSIDASAVNQISLLSEDGWIFVIDADVVSGIPVMTIKRHKEAKYPPDALSRVIKKLKGKPPSKEKKP